jgi:hypothetical protein
MIRRWGLVATPSVLPSRLSAITRDHRSSSRCRAKIQLRAFDRTTGGGGDQTGTSKSDSLLEPSDHEGPSPEPNFSSTTRGEAAAPPPPQFCRTSGSSLEFREVERQNAIT